MTDRFVREPAESPYFKILREEFNLQDLSAGAASQIDLVHRVVAWAHTRYTHDGMNEPPSSDPLWILREAAKGISFRCVEYGIITVAVLGALGQIARRLGLKTADVEVRECGAGHVVAEVFDPSRSSWFMVDPQFNAIPLLGEFPLSAYELRVALDDDRQNIRLMPGASLTTSAYLEWIAPYLYYLDFPNDQRFSLPKAATGRLMLVPPGAKRPKVFQRVHPMTDLEYTEDPKVFYKPPL